MSNLQRYLQNWVLSGHLPSRDSALESAWSLLYPLSVQVFGSQSLALDVAQDILQDVFTVSEEAKQNLKLFQAHGEADEVVNLHWGHSSNQLLKEWLDNGKSSESKHDFQFMKIPNMGHSSDQAEIDALKQVLKSWLS